MRSFSDLKGGSRKDPLNAAFQGCHVNESCQRTFPRFRILQTVPRIKSFGQRISRDACVNPAFIEYPPRSFEQVQGAIFSLMRTCTLIRLFHYVVSECLEGVLPSLRRTRLTKEASLTLRTTHCLYITPLPRDALTSWLVMSLAKLFSAWSHHHHHHHKEKYYTWEKISHRFLVVCFCVGSAQLQEWLSTTEMTCESLDPDGNTSLF